MAPGTEHALVTGASSGLGVLFARELAAAGWPLVLVARRADRLHQVAEEIRFNTGVDVYTFAADLIAPGEIDALMAYLAEKGLRIGTLVNNAGSGLKGKFADLSLARELEVMDLNMRAMVELTHRLLPPMRQAKLGGILNVASAAAFQAGPNMAIYYATKAFVLSFSEALHEELKTEGVHVTALCPGPVDTEMIDATGLRSSPLFVLMKGPALPVVRAGLAGLNRNRAVVVPGALTKLVIGSMRFMPASVPRKVAARLQP